MKNKKIIILVSSFVVVALISFFTGNYYANSKNKNTNLVNSRFQNGNMMGQKGARVGNGMVNGKVIAKDATSITVELRSPMQRGQINNTDTKIESGSRIVFYTDKTSVQKTIDGAMSDLEVGKDVNIIGTPNQDGSISATTISVRPTAPIVKQ